MPQVRNTAVRLASPGSNGSNLYNAYQVLAQIGSLYVKAQSGERNQAIAAIWTTLSDSALTDLGVLVNAWQAQTRTKNAAMARLDEPAITARIVRLCRRIEVIEARCSLWTTTATYIRILLLCEKHMQRILRQFVELAPEAEILFSGVIDSGNRRMEKLRQAFEVVRQAMRQLDDHYNPPVELSDAS